MRIVTTPGLGGVILALALTPLAMAAAPLGVAIAQSTSAGTTNDAPIVEPCAKDMAEGFECVTLTVPLDHFNDTGLTTQVTFAIKRHTARGPGKGVFVTATGGPGSSGIQSAVSYRDSFAGSVQRDYDVVFFDQRGAHLSGEVTCPDAAAAFYRTNSKPADSTATTGLGADAHTFVDDCIAETGVQPEMLPYYSTKQVAEDIEAFRAYLDVDKIQLYGESYGSQLAQTYAAAHPEHVEGLFLDGSVDLSRSALDYLEDQSRSFAEALEGTLLDCSTQEACTRDVEGASASAAWDALAARTDDASIPFTFHSGTGTTAQRTFTASDLLNAGSAYLFSEDTRMLLQRAVAAASQGDMWYLSRLLYAGLVLDPETQQAIPDPSYSDALFYAVECLDYALPGITPQDRATIYLAEGRDRGMETNEMGDIFYGDLPCAYWPASRADTTRPPLLTDVPYPMFIMGATLDPATPWQNAERIAAAAGDNAYLIVKPGGPHVIFGRGESCPDELVTAFLEHGTLPEDRRTVCPGDVADDYVPIPPLVATAYASTKAALRSADDEIINSADYWAWDGKEALSTGCRFGGTITYTPTRRGTELALDACSWSTGLGLTGTGLIDEDDRTLSLRVAQSGGDGPKVRYERNAKGRASVKGDLPLFADR